jgi:hypothetical protein
MRANNVKSNIFFNKASSIQTWIRIPEPYPELMPKENPDTETCKQTNANKIKPPGNEV